MTNIGYGNCFEFDAHTAHVEFPDGSTLSLERGEITKSNGKDEIELCHTCLGPVLRITYELRGYGCICTVLVFESGECICIGHCCAYAVAFEQPDYINFHDLPFIDGIYLPMGAENHSFSLDGDSVSASFPDGTKLSVEFGGKVSKGCNSIETFIGRDDELLFEICSYADRVRFFYVRVYRDGSCDSSFGVHSMANSTAEYERDYEQDWSYENSLDPMADWIAEIEEERAAGNLNYTGVNS